MLVSFSLLVIVIVKLYEEELRLVVTLTAVIRGGSLLNESAHLAVASGVAKS
jgi:hypothetical protein